MQIRQNTRAVRSSSYRQAAEQTWNYCLALAQDPSLAELIARQIAGEALTPAEEIRVNGANQALIFGFENMLRLREEDLIDRDVWENVIANSLVGIGTPQFRVQLAARRGRLSRRLLKVIDEILVKYPPATP